jgi:hypothetical protein
MGRLARHPSPGVQRWLAERRMAVGKEIRVTPNSGVELVLIPGGSFFMGSPESEKDRSQGEGPRLRRFVKNTTPRAVQACHELILWLIPQLDKFPRSRRFTLEERLETILLEILELLVEAFFSRDAENARPSRGPIFGWRSRATSGGSLTSCRSSRPCGTGTARR